MVGPMDGGGRRALEDAAARVAVALRGLCETTPVDLESTAAIRRACAAALGIDVLVAGSPSGRAADAVVEMATQVSVDVAAVDDDLRGRFLDASSDDAFAVIQAVYVADLAPRAMAVLDQLFGPSRWDLAQPVVVEADQTWAAIEDLMRLIHDLDRLDPVLGEVIRLRGARQHDCRLCRSLRSRPALVEGATEATFDAIDEPGWPSLPPRTRTALALVDATIWHPARVGPDLVVEVRRELRPDEAVEVVLDVMRNAANKIAVALGADAPHVTEGIEVYEVDSDGVARYGLDAPAPR